MGCCEETCKGRKELLEAVESKSVLILFLLEVALFIMYVLEMVLLYSYGKGYWVLLSFFLLQLIYIAYFANDQRKKMAALYAVLVGIALAGFVATCAIGFLVEYQNFLIELKIVFNLAGICLAALFSLVLYYPQEHWFSERFKAKLRDERAVSNYTLVTTDGKKWKVNTKAVKFYYLFGCSWIMAVLIFAASLHSCYIAYLAFNYDEPSSSFVSVFGKDVRVRCGGTGSPPIILLHGLGGQSLDYAWMQPELEKETRVCSYDRPGYGESFARGSLPRTAEKAAVELEQLLPSIGVTGDFLVVAHSYGSWIMREYVARNPGRIQGAVLLDPVNENSTADCDPNREYYPPNFLSPLFLSALFLSDSGGLELLDWSGILDANWDVDELPPAARDVYVKPDSLYYRTTLDEYSSFGKSCDSAKKISIADRRLDFPLTVIGAQKGIHKDVKFLEDQRDLSPNGTFVLYDGARHSQLVFNPGFAPRTVNFTLALVDEYRLLNP